MKSSKTISAVAYITIQADIASREGAFGPGWAELFFQCASVGGERTLEAWDALVVAAKTADVSIAEAIEFGEEG